MNSIRMIVCALLVLATCACSDDPKRGSSQTFEEAKQGVAEASAALAAALDKLASDMSGKADEIEREINAAKPEMKSKLNELKATFDEQWALAKRKFAEANAATPQKVETLKQEARDALAAAKKSAKVSVITKAL